MRKEIRSHLLNNIEELKEVYEYGVATKDSEKPYAIVIETKDINEDKILRFTKNIEIWFYCERTSFSKLDKITEKAIKALDKVRLEGEDSFTCVFDGYVLHDGVDDEFNVIYRGLRFQVINLYEDDNSEYIDPWILALEDYIKPLLPDVFTIQKNTWKKNFKAPGILLRVKRVKKERVNYRLTKERKTIVLHCLTDDYALDSEVLNAISDNLSFAYKIPLNKAEKLYISLVENSEEGLQINYEANPLSRGQMTMTFSRLVFHDSPDPGKITEIYSRFKGGDLNGN